MQVGIRRLAAQRERTTIRQRLAPQQLVVSLERLAVGVRILSGWRVGPDVERDVNPSVVTAHLRNRGPFSGFDQVLDPDSVLATRPTSDEILLNDLVHEGVARRGFSADETHQLLTHPVPEIFRRL